MTIEEKIIDEFVHIDQDGNITHVDVAGIAALVESERKAGYQEGFNTGFVQASNVDKGFDAGAREVADLLRIKNLQAEFHREIDQALLAAVFGKEN